MRTDDNLCTRAVAFVLAMLGSAQILAGCWPEPDQLGALRLTPAIPELTLRAPAPPPRKTTSTTQKPDPRATWCEPIDLPFCSTAADCEDGSACVRPWWAETDEAKVCARPSPTSSERRWRSNRLRVVVDHVCRRADGCDPSSLHAYLRLLALRESTWRPWKRSRLDPDMKANALAWSKHRDKFAGNPAASDPDRWSTGVGLYSQIPALWLPRWDASAPPETLCGEVEATEAHLRAARDQVRKIARGVDCDGDGELDYWGSACTDDGSCRPGWYDVARTNSGSTCPGDRAHHEAFARRAERVGLELDAPVTAADLGQPIPRDQQDEIAEQLRAGMALVPRGE